MFTTVRLVGLAVVLVSGWFLYGWGKSVIQIYNDNIVRVTQLERTNALYVSRLNSKQLVLDRMRAAIDQSRCKAQIDTLLKNPDLLKKRDVFNPDVGN